MKITLLTAGTRGDTQPFVALAVELKKLGEQVTVVGGENFKSFVESYDINFISTRWDISKIISSGLVDDAIYADNPLKFVKSLRNKNLLKTMKKLQEDYYTACQDCDAIIYHPGAAIGASIGEFRKIPTFLASPFPIIKTKEYPALIFYRMKIPQFLNSITHSIFYIGFWLAIKTPIKSFYKDKLNTKIRLKNPLMSKDLKFIACSNYVFKTEKEGFASGYWFLDEPADYKAPPQLLKFINEGPKPIYIGFGSVGSADKAENMTRIIVEAVKIAGVRVIISTGYGGLSNIEDTPKSIHIIEKAPHAWLFPQMAAVMHHGGAGTTSAGFRAGVPTIIVPHGNDQFAWGQRVYELGVGPQPIKVNEFTVENLVHAFTQIKDPAIIQNAATLGEKIRQEAGAENAAKRIIEKITK